MFNFSGPQLRNPSRDAEESAAVVDNFLEQGQLEVDVEAAIVFVHPMVHLDVEQPDFPVLHLDELGAFLQDIAPDPSFSSNERDRIVELLAQGDGVERPSQQRSRRRVKRRAA